MMDRLERRIQDETLVFLREMAVYWPRQRSLLLSDLHAGKAAHFRQHGIPLSSDHLLQDLNVIDRLIEQWKPERLLILGDLFHTTHNLENALVVEWLHQLPIDYLLVEGNHDRHALPDYSLHCTDLLEEGPFVFRHEPDEADPRFQINGHVHPGFSLRGKAKQRLRLPAFYLDQRRLILPAFGRLNGMKTLKKNADNELILIGPQGLLPLDQ